MFIVACVVYNKKIDLVTSLPQFIKLASEYDNVRIIFLDNTTKEEIKAYNQRMKDDLGISYISDQGNIGLSKAYNKVLDCTAPEDWILWTDDDTWFSNEYLENAYAMANQNMVMVMAGIVVTTANTRLSPTFRNHDDNTIITEGMQYDNLYCINSGLCVKRSIYENIGYYDEKLFIDMIDYWLFDEMHKKELDHTLILKGDIRQNFSGISDADIGIKLKRFRIYCHDFLYYCKTEKRSWIYRIRILSRRLFNILIGHHIIRK